MDLKLYRKKLKFILYTYIYIKLLNNGKVNMVEIYINSGKLWPLVLWL